MCSQLISEKQVWRIVESFEFTNEELLFLRENPISEESKWDNKKYKPIKDRIRKHYFEKQNFTCAYCRLPINIGTDNLEIEHVVDKNNRSDFTFEPLNLVVSCHRCNFAKSTKKVLHACPPPNTYPTGSDSFKIIHSHFDDYFEHIEFIRGSIYHALTDKGDFTIEKCGLEREGLAEQREEIVKYQDDPIIAKVIELRNSGMNEALLDDILQQLNNIKKNE